MKCVSPDFPLGRILVGTKSKLQLCWLVISQPSKQSLRFARLVIKVKPRFTMVKNRNLQLLYDLASEATLRELPGDIVECGVWNGGSAAIMAAASMNATLGKEFRTLWLFDSFRGLPRPGERDGDLEKKSYFTGWNTGCMESVEEVFRKIGYPKDKLRIVPGWFNETLMHEPVKDIVLLHIDADWYESVKAVLQAFYQRVVPGGFVVLDDYGLWPGCRQALIDYFAEQNISGITIKKTGRQGAFFEKPSSDK